MTDPTPRPEGDAEDSAGQDVLELFNSESIVEDPHGHYEPDDPDADGDAIDADAPAPPG